jgi:hypothetical protein
VECDDWVDEVLAGLEDSMFEAMKNPWSNEITPENVGGNKGAIVEMRDISAYGIHAGYQDLTDTNGIVDIFILLIPIATHFIITKL